MTARLRSWWQYIREHWVVTLIIALVIVFALIICVGYWLKWDVIELINAPKKTVATEIIRSPQEKVTTTEEGRMLWDWLQLLGVLAIPVVVGFGTLFFTRQQAKTSEANAENQRQEELLRTYFDKISELLLNKELSTNPNIQSIVRARTLAALRILSTKRKAIVLRFLHDSDLLKYVKSFLFSLDLSHADLHTIDLSGANLLSTDLRDGNLWEANFNGAHLQFADLSGAYLPRANFRDAELGLANLSGANLSGANLIGADLWSADLRGANLSGATITPEQLEEAINVTPEQFAQIKTRKLEAPQEAKTAQPSTTPAPSEIKSDHTSQEEAEQQEHIPPKQDTYAASDRADGSKHP